MYHQLGLKLVFAGAYSRYHRLTLTTSGVATRRRNGFLVLWKRPKKSGKQGSVEKPKKRPELKRLRYPLRIKKWPPSPQTTPSYMVFPKSWRLAFSFAQFDHL